METNSHKTVMYSEASKADITVLKKEIRKKLLKVRSSIEEGCRSGKDSAIFSKITALEEYKEAGTVLTYASYNGEADTYRLINRAMIDGKRVGCPVCNTGFNEPLLDFYYISSTKDLIEGYRGIPEPDTDKCTKVSEGDISKALIIVPMVGYDSFGNRLGYGKGFYDRFLGRHDYLRAVGIAYSCQECERIPVDEYDVRPDIIITE